MESIFEIYNQKREYDYPAGKIKVSDLKKVGEHYEIDLEHSGGISFVYEKNFILYWNGIPITYDVIFENENTILLDCGDNSHRLKLVRFDGNVEDIPLYDSNNVSTNNSNYFVQPPKGVKPAGDPQPVNWEDIENTAAGKLLKEKLDKKQNSSATSIALSNISNSKCVTEYPDDITVDQMDTVTFGNYYNSDGNVKEPIEWLILEKQGDKALLLSKNIVDAKKYSDDDVNFDCSWNNSIYKTWLNNDFLNTAFNASEKAQIINNNVFNDFIGDKIFILNTECLDKYFNIFSCEWTEANTGRAVRDKNNALNSYASVFEKEIRKLSVKATPFARENYGHDCDFFYFYHINNILPIHSTLIGTNEGGHQFFKTPIRPAMWVNISYGTTSANNESATNGWKVEDGITVYYMNGSKAKGWTEIDGDWYFFAGPGGRLETNCWVSADGGRIDEDDPNQYYVGTDGKMLKNTTTPDDFQVDTDGKKITTAKTSSLIAGMPQQESELRNDGHFYLDNNMQKSSWVYYVSYYYHVDGAGNIEKSKWIEQRYVGEDGRMYRGRQTPDGKWVGDDGLVIKDVVKDLKDSALIEEIQSDAWYKTQSGLWYYFENDRTTTRKGWFTDNRDGQTYYLDPSTGIMAVGWTEIDGDMYYFNENGGTEPNWYEVGDGIYESYGKQVKSLGSMYKNGTTPDGREVDEDGKLKKDDDITEKDMMIYDDKYIIAILQYSDSNIFKIKSLDVICEKKQFLFFTISSNYYLHIYLDSHMVDGCKDIIEKSVGNDAFLRIDDEMIEMTSKNLSFDDESMIIHYTSEEGAENIYNKINNANNVLFLLIKNK